MEMVLLVTVGMLAITFIDRQYETMRRMKQVRVRRSNNNSIRTPIRRRTSALQSLQQFSRQSAGTGERSFNPAANKPVATRGELHSVIDKALRQRVSTDI